MSEVLKGGEYKIEPWRPMAEWHQYSAHDSAAACERAKTEAVAKLWPSEQTTDPTLRRKLETLAFGAGMYYRCLPASQVPMLPRVRLAGVKGPGQGGKAGARKP